MSRPPITHTRRVGATLRAIEALRFCALDVGDTAMGVRELADRVRREFPDLTSGEALGIAFAWLENSQGEFSHD
jgi:hypothetical protein